MNTSVAKIISYIFHPLAIPTYLFATLFFVLPQYSGLELLGFTTRISLLFMITLYTFIAPSMLVWSLLRMNKVESIELKTLTERRTPLFMTAIIYGFATYFFGFKFDPITQLAPQIGILLAAFTLTILLVALVSLYWQISVHAAGIFGAIGFLLILALRQHDPNIVGPLVGSILISGWVSSARLKLNAHTSSQIIAGGILGFSICALFQYFLF